MPQPNMQKMMKQFQKMQADIAAAEEELKHETVEVAAGGGMVKVVVTGDTIVKSVEIDPTAVDPDDVEMLQDLVVAAVNEGIRAAQELASEKMNKAAGDLGALGGGLGGLGIPGMPGF